MAWLVLLPKEVWRNVYIMFVIYQVIYIIKDGSKVSTIFAFFPSRFAILSELVLNQVELCAELNSASIDTVFKVCHRSKSATYTLNTPSNDYFTRYSPSRFAILSELVLNQIELCAEFNSSCNWILFRANSGSIANRDGKNANMVLTLLTSWGWAWVKLPWPVSSFLKGLIRWLNL
jgi:hypothetical protein